MLSSSQSSQEFKWLVARLRPGASDRALDELDRNSVNYYYPKFKTIHGDEQPLIRGYVFVPVDVFTDLNFIQNIDGVVGFLPIGSEKPQSIPQNRMNEFIDRVEHHDYDEVESCKDELPRFHKNEMLGIISGPFMGHTCVFRCVRKGAVEVSVNFLGTSLNVLLKGHQIQRLS